MPCKIKLKSGDLVLTSSKPYVRLYDAPSENLWYHPSSTVGVTGRLWSDDYGIIVDIRKVHDTVTGRLLCHAALIATHDCFGWVASSYLYLI